MYERMKNIATLKEMVMNLSSMDKYLLRRFFRIWAFGKRKLFTGVKFEIQGSKFNRSPTRLENACRGGRFDNSHTGSSN